MVLRERRHPFADSVLNRLARLQGAEFITELKSLNTAARAAGVSAL
jgi:hypothetical protein